MSESTEEKTGQKTENEVITRRGFIGVGSAALAAAGILTGSAATGQEPGNSKQDRSKSDPGPKDAPLDAHNPDSTWPPATDSKSLVQTFKYPFSFANKRTYEGGWSREVTIRELAVSKTLAGVNMRLTAGGVRELHWHTADEWAILLYGSARITAIDRDGKSFVADVKKNDLWYFPSGIPHSIQGLDPDGTEFMLVFDDGNFSESETVLLSDSMAHLPREVLAKNFGVGEQVFNNLPKQELFIFKTAVPGALEADQKAAAGGLGKAPADFAFRTMEMPPTKRTKGGEVRIVDSSTFKASANVAMAMVTLRPGGLRELHWHPNADEWQYYIAGKGRMTVFVGAATARTMDFEEGDVGYVPISNPHYIENTGDTDLVVLEMFRSSEYQDISLADWMAHTPHLLMNQHLGVGMSMLNSIPEQEAVVVPL